MRHFRQLFFLGILLFLSTITNAYDFSSNGVYYNITSSVDNTVEVTYQSKTRVPYGYGYTDSWVSGMTGSKTIPSQVTYNGIIYTVTAIGEHAFYQSTATKVSLPNTIKSIGYYAFYGSSINEMTIPSSVTSLGTYAFGNCNNITSITIPSTVTDGGTYTFSYCANLSSAIVYCESIPYDCFSYCTKLSSVTIGSGVKTINRDAFERCYSLESLTIPDAVTTMPESAISECTGLKELNIGKGLQSFSNTGIASQCPLEKITVSSLNQYLSSPSNSNVIIEKSTNTLLLGCTNSVIPSTVKKIGNYAFRGCKIKSIIIPYYVTEIGNHSFYNCNALESVTFSSDYNLTTIGNYSFYGCKTLKKIQLPSCLTSLGDDAFSNCTNLVDISFGSSSRLTNIGAYAFNYCSSLPVFSIPASVATIGNYAFSGCSGLKHVIVNSSSTSSIPNITEGVFSANTYTTAKLHCLYQSVLSTLQFKSPWSKFSVVDKYWEGNVGGYNYMDMSATDAVVIIGETATLKAIPMFSKLYAASLNEVMWSSSNDKVAIVDQNGTVTGIAPGTATIIASKMYGNSITGTCEITVKYENSLYANNQISLAGSKSVLPIYMDNAKEICNLQFDITLPEGVDIHYGENDDEEEVYFVAKGERAKAAHTAVVNKLDDRKYRVLISSSSNVVFKDTDKSLSVADITLDIDKELTPGDYQIQLSNAMLANYANGVTTPIAVVDTTMTLTVPPPYNVDVAASDENMGSVFVKGTHYNESTKTTIYGDELTLTATPAAGYSFSKWTENAVSVSTNNPYTFTVNANRTIKADFTPNKYNVTFVVDGTTYNSSLQTFGNVISTPSDPSKVGYTFRGWKDLTTMTTVPANDVTYEAVFEINQYSVKFIADGVEVYNQKQDYGSSIVAPEAPIKDRYVFISWGEMASAVPASAVTYTAEYALLGDTYEDSKINVADLTKLVGIILNSDEELTDRQLKIADVYKDNKINVADYTTLVGFVLNSTDANAKEQMPERASVKRRAAEANEYQITSDDIRVEKGTESADMNIYMSNTETISALQFDITFPEGIDVFYGENEDEDMVYFINKGERAKTDHTASYKKLGERTYRVMISSPTNASFKETEANRTKPVAVIKLTLANGLEDGNYTANISNIVFSHYDNVNITSVPYYPADVEAKIVVGNSEEEIPVLTEIALVDGENYSNIETKNVDALTFTKTFSASAVGNWNALYVPMSIDVEEYAGELDFAEIYAFCATVDTNGDGTVDANDENFLFVRPVKTGCIDANVPYLIRPHEAKTYTINSADNILHKAENGYVEFSTTRDKFTVTGLNEAYTVVAGDNNYYVSATGKLNYRTTGSTSVKANRWIMHRESKKYGSSTPASMIKEYRIIALGEEMDEATAIEMIQSDNAGAATIGDVYTIDGKKIPNAQKLSNGIYIQNGKKIVVK